MDEKMPFELNLRLPTPQKKNVLKNQPKKY